MRLSLCNLILFVFVSSLYAQQTNIAILDFEPANLSQADARILTDRLRTELFNREIYQVIDRTSMEEILKEQGYTQTGCVSKECAVEVGKLVGVEQIVTGSIGKLGGLYTITARVIDVESGRILVQKSHDCRCEIEELLTKSIAEIAEGLNLSDVTTKQYFDPWEILQITRDEYVQFLRLGINERDWIDKYQSAGLTVSDLTAFKTENIPPASWLEFKKLNLTPDQYVRFHNLKIDPYKWLNEYQPAGLTLDEIEEYQQREIPLEYWKLHLTPDQCIRFQNLKIDLDKWLNEYQPAGLTLDKMEELYNLKIDPDKWLKDYQSAGFTLDEVEEYQERKIPSRFWAYVKRKTSESVDVDMGNDLLSHTPKTIVRLIDIGIIDRHEYEELLSLAAFNFIVLIDISNIGAYQYFNPSSTFDACRFISRVLNEEELAPSSLHLLISSWKQSIFKSLPPQSRSSYRDWVYSLSVWEWLIVRKFEISNEQFINASGKL